MAAITKGITVSFSNTPQAKDDVYNFGEGAENTVQNLYVMSNDLAGGAKSLYSIDDANNTSDLLVARTTSVSQLGATIRIVGDHVEYDTAGDLGDLDHLAQGETLTDTFTYAIRMANGAISWATAKVVLTGTNDGPVATLENGGSVTEDAGTTTVVGSLADNVSDVDNGAVLHFSPGGAGTFGNLVVNTTTGQWVYTLNNLDSDTDALAQGESATETFTFTVTDEYGATATSTLTVTVNGANDGPTASAETGGSVVEDTASDTVGGSLADNASDVDHGASLTFSGSAEGKYGDIAVDANGDWVYTLNNDDPDTNALAEGESATETFTFTVTDEHNATATQTVTVTVTGTNDAAEIDGDTDGAVTEAGGVANGEAGQDQATGDLNATDVDNTDGFQVASGTGDNGYGTFEIDADGNWAYTLNNDNADVQELNVGDTATDTFTVKTDDGTEQTVTITINGANDAAEIDGDTGGAVTEAGGVANGDAGEAQATGDLDVTDVDNTDGFQADSGDGDNGYGTFEIDADGQWAYTLNDTNVDVQELNVGDTATDTFTVKTDDGTEQTVTITINGANDAAEIDGDTVGDVTEAGGMANGDGADPQVAGDLDATDVDDTDGFQVDSGDGDNGYGTFDVDANGSWIYTLNNDNADVQELNVGDTATDTFTVKTDDGTEQTVTITIHGANDAAVIDGDVGGDVTEAGGVANGVAGAPQATGDLDASDVDGSDGFQTGAGASDNGYGTFEIDADGNWAYTLNNDNADVQELNVGDTATDTFTVLTDDGTEQTVTITIHGANDTPTVSAEAGGPVTEDSATTTVGGTLNDNVSDVDGSTFAFTVSGAGTYGTLTIPNTTDGQWIYILNNSDPDTNALNNGQTATDTFTFTVTDVHGAQATQTLTVTVIGHTDAPSGPPVDPADTGTDPNDFDTLTGASSGSPTTGADTLVGGIGNDTVDARNGNDLVYGGAGNDTIIGNNGDDRLYGQAGNDSVLGSENDDLIYGGSGNDVLEGNNNNDTIYGGSGADFISGGNGTDSIVGGLGSDTIAGNAGSDTLTGSPGLDSFVFNSTADASDVITDYSPDYDTLLFSASGFSAASWTAGALTNANELESGAGLTAATAAASVFVYNTTTGDLYYDTNGNAAGGSTLIAHLNGAPALTSDDFHSF